MRTLAEMQRNQSQGQFVAPGISILGRVLRWVGVGALALASLAGPPMPGAAQAAATLIVQPPVTDHFPLMTVEFKLTDANHHPLGELQAEHLTVVENGVDLPVSELATDYRGVDFALVVNGSREMDLRDEAGLSRYEKLAGALQSWAAGWHFRGEDAWSLVTGEGLGIRNAGNAVEWMTALDAYQPNFRLMEPDPASLAAAVQTLQEEVVPFGVDKVLLYLTPPPAADQISEITALTETARAAGIQVNVWMVGEALYLANDQGGALLELAAATGGQFFHYTGAEAIPDPGAILAPLGYAQQLTYTSALRASGTFPLAIRAEVAGIEASGESQPFYIEVQPPNPMFLSPPVTVTRQPAPEAQEDSVEAPPDEVLLQILVEFPDGHPRGIVASRLLVDGVVAGVNEQAPFDVFHWDISSLNESGEHTIQVEVEDEVGLAAATLLTPVQLETLESESSPGLSGQQITMIAVGAVLAVAVGLLAAWLGRKVWHSKPVSAIRGQRLAAGMEPGSNPHGELPAAKRCYAMLIPEGEPDGLGLAITQPRVLLGGDPQQVDLHLRGKGLDPVQAELTLEAGAFWLRNLGAGQETWLNYEQIGTERVQIRAGDMVHFGDLGFRFTINEPATIRKVSVSRYDPF